jgi:hypothetical protein
MVQGVGFEPPSAVEIITRIPLFFYHLLLQAFGIARFLSN